MTGITIGAKVGYRETFKGSRWVKIGTVVDLDGNGRARVKWSSWHFESGHVRQDSKRTWVRIAALEDRSQLPDRY